MDGEEWEWVGARFSITHFRTSYQQINEKELAEVKIMLHDAGRKYFDKTQNKCGCLLLLRRYLPIIILCYS